jgi:excisionase family DNA binding protein
MGLKTSRRRTRTVVSRSTHARGVRWPSPLATVASQVEIPLPAALRKDRSLERGSVALVDVEGNRLKLRFLRSSLLGDEGLTLTASEEASLVKGGVEPVSEEDLRVVDAQIASAYQQLRTASLSVEEAARRLGVNASRIRQRLAERSLYGLKDGNTWLLPAFQFGSDGLVPGVGVVVRRLPLDIGALAVARWFSGPNPDLSTRDDDERPLTPLEWLLGGNPPEAAAELAAAL